METKSVASASSTVSQRDQMTSAGSLQRSTSQTASRPTVPPKPAFRVADDRQLSQHQQTLASSRLKTLPLVDLTTRIRSTSSSSASSDNQQTPQTPISPFAYPVQHQHQNNQYDEGSFLSEEAFRSRNLSVGRKSEDESNGKLVMVARL